MAWQFDRPDRGEGMVQAFRRPNCSVTAVSLKLRGLEPGTLYKVTNLGQPGESEVTGRELMGSGLLVALRHQPDSALIVYKRARPRQ